MQPDKIQARLELTLRMLQSAAREVQGVIDRLEQESEPADEQAEENQE